MTPPTLHTFDRPISWHCHNGYHSSCCSPICFCKCRYCAGTPEGREYMERKLAEEKRR